MAYYRFIKKKAKWKEIKPEDKIDSDIKLHEKMIDILKIAKKNCGKDGDYMMIIFGKVGSGKSTLGRLLCRYFSNDRFRPIKHMVKNEDDVQRVISNAKKGDAIVFDEGSLIVSSTDTMTKKTKYTQRVLDVCRQKNLLIVIIAPQIHRLLPSIVMDRARVAMKTYIHKKHGRGHFAFYGNHLKNKLYVEAKKNYGKINIGPKWHGDYGDDLTYKEEYKKVKDETLNITLDSLTDNGSKTGKKLVEQRNNLIKYIRTYFKLNDRETMNKLKKECGVEVSRSTIQQMPD